MANVGRTFGRWFPTGEGAAHRLPNSESFSAYNPLLRRNFTITGFHSIYQSTEYPETGGRPLCEALGPPLQDQSRDGAGTEFQHFHRGHLSWTEAGGFAVQLDFPIGDGWGRKLPAPAFDPLDPKPEWGHLFSVFNPSKGQRFTVGYGFAIAYDRTDFPGFEGRPLYEVLGPPRGKQESDGADGAYQQFEHGRLVWNPRDDVQVQLGVVDAPEVQDSLRKRLGLEGTKRISRTQLAQLGGEQPRPIRLRLAPSPTGYLHAGNAWIAVVNFLAAKKLGGEFLLRIEDTDPLRSRPEYTEVIKESLQWLGLPWDGEILFQSQRSEIYRQHVNRLLAEDKAYRDPKTGAIFFRMPKVDRVTVNDRVKGAIQVPVVDEEGKRDFMLVRPDGSPMFLLANTVDDGLQGITHMIRGDGHLTNAARQVCLFEALGFPVPEMFHLPHVLGEDGGKLSKREGAVSVLDFRDQGIDPELLRDHLARLGSKKSWDDTPDLDTLIERFDRFGFGRNASRIGLADLLGRMKQRILRMDTNQLRHELAAFGPHLMQQLDPLQAYALADGVKKRASTYEEAIRIGEYVLSEPQYAQQAALVNLTTERRALLSRLKSALEAAPSWRLADVTAALNAFNQRERIGFPAYADTLSWALVGEMDSLPVDNQLAILGRARALERLANVLEDRIQLVPEVMREQKPAEKQAEEEEERPPPPDLAGVHLQLYLQHARGLGAPIAAAGPDGLGQTVQRFEKGLTGDRGQVQLEGRPFWIGGSKLETYLQRRDLIGDATGEAYRSSPGAESWVQRFDRAVVADDGHVLLDGHQHWIAGGKLDAWSRCPELLGPTAGDAYFTFGEWRQNFERGQTSDAGAVRLEGSRFWIGAPILGTWLAHREALGHPLGDTYRQGEQWVQEFERGRIRGETVELGASEIPPLHPAIVEGALVREEDQAAVFLIAGGAKLHVVDQPTFERLGYQWANVAAIPPGSLRYVSEIPADGTLAREADRHEVWVIRDGKKAHVPSWEAFDAAGLDRNGILTVPDKSLWPVVQTPF